MSPDAIFGPFFASMLLTLVVWVYMYARRIPFIARSRLTPAQLRPEEFARLSPPAVANPSDNLRNLFELPTLFYALCLYLYVTRSVDLTALALAWCFVVLRAAHSLVHATFNRVPLRFLVYAASSLALWALLLRSALQALAGHAAA
jgi:hypothetical protein